MNPLPKSAVSVTILCVLAIVTVPAEGIMIPPDHPVPIDRLIDNLSRYVEGHPDDARGHYLLGRVHALGFVENKKTFDTWGLPADPERSDRPAVFLDMNAEVPPKNSLGGGPIDDSRKSHLLEAIRHYAKAVELERGKKGASGAYWLGLAYMCEEGSKFAESVEWPADATIDRMEKPSSHQLKENDWLERALIAYKGAFTDGLDAKYHDAYAIEGGHGILRIYGKRGRAEQRGTYSVGNVKARIERMKDLPQIVSPIIFSREGSGSFADLLATDSSINFDLDGFASGGSWPWLKPDTSLLVWDPEGTGRITSGRQLFGSVTWWVFWQDGYQALAALDDNSDGWLRGAELKGIAAWTDRNSNGLSEPGEVAPVGMLGINGIATQVAGRLPGGEPYASAGIELIDGTTLPTYDWTPQRLK